MPNQTPAGDAELRERIYDTVYHGLTSAEADHYTDWIMQLILADRKAQREVLKEAQLDSAIGILENIEKLIELDYNVLHLRDACIRQRLELDKQRTALHQLKDPERS